MILRPDGNKTEILLHRRRNTGYMDGKWDIAGSGHVDEGETARMAVVRECKEELGIDVDIGALTFSLLSHRLSVDRTYYDMYFLVDKYSGVPSNMEPEKCSELKWFDIEALPDEMIECRRTAVLAYKNKEHYNEIFEERE